VERVGSYSPCSYGSVLHGAKVPAELRGRLLGQHWCNMDLIISRSSGYPSPTRKASSQYPENDWLCRL